MIIPGIVAKGPSGGGGNGFIDPFYPTTAYSMRKRNSAYGGSCIRLRRSSDNAEQDIGFDADGWCDATAIASFIGANTGFVTTWYDQSGGGINLVMTDANKQPTVMNSGTLETLAGKPAILIATSGTADAMDVAANAAFGFGTSAFAIETYNVSNSTGADQALVDFRTGSGQDGTWQVAYSGSAPYELYYFNGTTFGNSGNGPSNGTPVWLALTYAGGAGGLLKGFVGGTQEWSTAATLNFGATRPLILAANFAFGSNYAGHWGEVLITKGSQVYSGTYTPRSYS